MNRPLLLGLWRVMLPIPRPIWQREVAQGASHSPDFITPDHRRVQHYVVRSLPGAGRPITPEEIGQALALPAARVRELLEELERHLTFVYRDAEGAVEWAYPVTVARTPHHVTLSTGEQVYAA